MSACALSYAEATTPVGDGGLQSVGLLANSRIIAVAVLRAGRILFANRAFEALFVTTGTLTGTRLEDLIEDSLGESLCASIEAAKGGPVSYLGSGRRLDGRTFTLELALEYLELDGQPALVAFAWDISRRVRSTRQLSCLAFTDGLTGLANRERFTDALRRALRAAESCGRVALLMLDLDGFKAVNDRYGHDAGDAVLQIAAQRIQGCLREEDIAARLGGDEFAVLLPGMREDEFAAFVALRVLGTFAGRMSVGTHELSLSASIGVAVFPTHAMTAEALVVAADTALYTAKRAGKNRYAWATARHAPEAVRFEPLLWNSAHELGIPVIDEQHAHLASLLDELARTLQTGEAGSLGGARLEAVVRYAKLHFAAEEQIMRDARIGDLGQHQEEHQRLLEEIENLELPEDDAGISLIVRYLREWLLRHVHGSDQRLADALLAKQR